MLYKNDEIYKLTPADIKLIKDKFKKFPVAIVYPESCIQPSNSPNNRLPDMPASMSFPLRGVVKSATGTEVWRYAENRIIDGQGRISYTPSNFLYTGSVYLEERDMELIWFLYTKSPYVEKGKNYSRETPMAVFEDTIGKADEKAAYEEKAATVKALIYSNQIGLSEEKLRQTAKAYFIPNVDDLTISQVRIAIESEIKSNRINGMEYFMNLVDAEMELEIRASVQNAIDKNLIKYVPNTREWVWQTSSGRKDSVICTVLASINPNEAIYEYYMGNKKFAQALVSSLKGNKVVLPDGKGDNISAGDEED